MYLDTQEHAIHVHGLVILVIYRSIHKQSKRYTNKVQAKLT